MNDTHPMMRFLGLDPNSDPLDTLGVQVSDLDEATLRSAVTHREEQILDHPDGESKDADEVRQHVRDAAELLLNPIARLTIIARHMPHDLLRKNRDAFASERTLTEFDRDVLGILVASGGWNAKSRARLMAVASRYRVSNERLLSVLTGMASWLQERAGTIRPESNGAGARLIDMPKPQIDESTGVVFDRFVNRWMSDLRSDDPKAINRMSILFGAVALILFGFMFFMMMLSSDGEQQEVLASSAVVDSAKATSVSGIDSSQVSGRADSMPLVDSEFDLPSLPARMTNAADGMSETIGSIDLMVAELNDGAIAMDLYPDFLTLFDQADDGWFLIGIVQREELLGSISRLFDSIGNHQESLTAYMGILRFEAGVFTSARQISESGFRSGVLSMLAGSARQSPAVRSLATEAIGQSGESGPRVIDFDSGVLLCLESFLPRMIELIDVDDESKLQWALWIRCVESIDQTMFQPALVKAVEAVAAGSINPAAEGASRTVLGSLLSRFDYEQSTAAKEMVLGWYTDSDIPSNRLEALTRLLVELKLSPRFDESIIIDPGSGTAFARLQRDALSREWGDVLTTEFEWRSPVPDGFDPVMVGIWDATWEVSQSKVLQMSDASLLRRQLEIRKLNEAASALSSGQNPSAMKLIREVETGSGEGETPVVLPFEESVSLDEWAVRLSRARSRDDKLKLLDQLDKVPSGSFDSSTAIQLAKVAYLGASAIRARAQQVIVRRFRDDPEIMIALLDSLPERTTKELNEFLESLLDRDLPGIKSERWRPEVRRLMIERSLLLRLASSAIIDRHVRELSTSYLDESRRLGANVVSASNEATPLDSIRTLSSIRMKRLRESFSIADARLLSDLRLAHESRRRLAGDAIQSSLMQSLFLSELMALEWSSRLPSISGDIEMILEDLKLDLPVSSHVLEQLVLVEEAMAAVWQLVLDTFVERQLQQEGAVG